MMDPLAIEVALSGADLPIPADVELAAEWVRAANTYRGAAPTLDDLAAAIRSRSIAPGDLPRVLRDRRLERLAHADKRVELDEVIRAASTMASSAVVADGDSIMAALRRRFDTAAATVTKSLKRVEKKGFFGTERESVPSPERDAALGELALVRSVRRMLSGCGYGERGEHGGWYSAPGNGDELLAANGALVGSGNPFVAIAESGVRLRLSTLEQADAAGRLADKKPLVRILG